MLSIRIEKGKKNKVRNKKEKEKDKSIGTR
jgi:hypothetical protein